MWVPFEFIYLYTKTETTDDNKVLFKGLDAKDQFNDWVKLHKAEIEGDRASNEATIAAYKKDAEAKDLSDVSCYSIEKRFMMTTLKPDYKTKKSKQFSEENDLYIDQYIFEDGDKKIDGSTVQKGDAETI